MSTGDSSGDGDADSNDGGPGRREVAHRLFAAEFDDASLSYSESDEERAPNYVVTPTGARVNRLFAVGVLTAVEAVNEETLRARIADPTGAFVSYAGQYQPDEMAFLDRTSPPAFLALTGKARTFEPEDSDRVFTSVRPESINEVDADTRDRWVVETARATLDRVRVFADALDTGLRGDELRTHLESQGVPAALAEGIPLAMDHYGTTTAYLEAVRTLAVETLEVVADERDEASSLDLAPDEGGDAEIGPLPAGDTDLSVDVDVGSEASAEPTAGDDDAVESTADEPADGVESTTDEPADAAEATADEDEHPDEIVEATTTGTAEASESDEQEESSPAADSAESTDEPTEPTTAETSTADSPTDTATETTPDESGDELGDFGSGDDSGTGTDAETGADDLGDFGSVTETDDVDVDPEDVDDVLDDETREAVKSEHGVGFSTGNEVDDPGEADIDVPDADELEEMAAEAESDTTTSTTTSAETSADAATTADADAASEADDSTATESEDVDLETAVLDAMKAEDDGDGAARADVISAVVAEHGVTEAAVEDAIQEALMSGLCYEAGDGLKPI